MTTVISSVKFRYHIYNKVNLSDIDFGATPDRTNKQITFKCSTLEQEIKEMSVGGHMYEIIVPVSIDIYQRMPQGSGRREEPQHLIEIEKYLVEWFAINRLSLQSEGVNHMQLKTIRTVLGDKYDNWYHTQIVVEMVYLMVRALG